ncbi:MAG: pilus assembly protein PilM [candidate division NC10 bacterium]|nr:pilus assembly protein PilM [candidate division NC10 bacterium]
MGWRFPLGLSISLDEIRAVRIVRRGRRLRVAGRRAVPLPPGAVTAAPHGLAIADEDAFVKALKEALALSGRYREVALALPDSSCLARVLRFPDLQARGEELRALILWQAADLLPFPQKEARLTCQVLRREGSAGQVAYLLAHEALLSRMEALLARAGGALLYAGSALICLHNAWDRATEGRGSEGLLHLGGGAFGLLLQQDGIPAYARSVPMTASDGQPKAILREVEASLDFATGREGVPPPPRLLLAGEGDLGPTAAVLVEALRIPTEILGDGVAAWGAFWEGLPPTAVEAAAVGAALSPEGSA